MLPRSAVTQKKSLALVVREARRGGRITGRRGRKHLRLSDAPGELVAFKLDLFKLMKILIENPINIYAQK